MEASTLRLNAVQLMLAAAPPSRSALVGPRGSLCYGELQQAVARAAWAWQDCGVLPGETVLVRLAPGVAHAVALLGAIWAGAVPLPLAREVAAREWQAWAASQRCRFVLDESREGYATAWRDQVLTRGEWRVALQEATPVPAVAADPAAPACWTDFRAGRPLRLLAHCFALARAEHGASLPGRAHTATALGLLRALRRGATVVLPQAQTTAPSSPGWRPALAGVAP